MQRRAEDHPRRARRLVRLDQVLGDADPVRHQRAAQPAHVRAAAGEHRAGSARGLDRGGEIAGQPPLVRLPGAHVAQLREARSGGERDEDRGGRERASGSRAPRACGEHEPDGAAQRDQGGAGQRVARVAGEAGLRHQRDERDPGGAGRRGRERRRGGAAAVARPGHDQRRDAGPQRPQRQRDRLAQRRQGGHPGERGLARVRHPGASARAQRVARPEQLRDQPGGRDPDGERRQQRAVLRPAAPQQRSRERDERPRLDPQQRAADGAGERDAHAPLVPRGRRTERERQQQRGLLPRGRVGGQRAAQQHGHRAERAGGARAAGQPPGEPEREHGRDHRRRAHDEHPEPRRGRAERGEQRADGDGQRLERRALERAEPAGGYLAPPEQPRPRVVRRRGRHQQQREQGGHDGGGEHARHGGRG